MSVSKSGSICVKRFRDKLGLYIGLPGHPKRFNLNLGLADDKASERLLEDEVIPRIRSHMVLGNWKALHELYPGCAEFAVKLPNGAGLTMDDLFERMVRNWRDKNRRSLEDMLHKLKEVREYFTGKRVCDVDYAVIQAFVDQLRKRVGPATANRKLAQVRRAFNYAYKKGWIKERPAFPDSFEEPLPRQTRYTGIEVELLIEKMPRRHKGLIRVASLTGWRLEELLSRKWRTDVDYEAVHPDYPDIPGVLYLDAGSSKNKEPRRFPLTPRLKAALDEQIAWVKELELTTGRIIPWLFPNDDARHQVGDRMKSFRKALYRACDELGLNIDPNTGKTRVHEQTGKPERRWFHDFRRTAQEHLEKMGLSDEEQMELIGHKTRSMHSRYRGESSPERVAGIGAKLAKAEAAVVASGAKVVPFVQPVCNATSAEGIGNEVSTKKSVNSRGFGWAGVESNHRHKDFQS